MSGPFPFNMSHASIREITVIICIIPSDFLYSASYEQLHITDGGGLTSLLNMPAFLAQA